ncbi:MAG TPA: aldehyde dehydrogenase [Chitinophagales bacterium]|nr:aldehyde dehydrogenase [Chitinophagales bacterium]HMZ34657.1 aldehyde dehydrogenase [Chitinophagales bacterium]HNA39382.1 aldehyde dehydrogenase [Chitinophagales bacterium]HNB48480.1 aldehyde dehydrogenase [Chitinophagales bacterium]HNG72364.1 aldehyde dehydrogenase [Chitinophagales bacterium]
MSATVETKVYTSFDAASLVNTQRQFFNTGKTKDVEFRIQQLKKLRQIIADNETAIVAALKADLNKSPMEAFATEFGFMLADIDHTLKDIRTLAKPRKVKTPLFHQLGSSWIQAEPFGCTYIIAPWNYPFQLALSPVVGAVAAGNTCLIRPSRMSENTAKILEKLINENFDPGFLKVVLCDTVQSNQLLEHKFDYIFFTGSPDVGRQIYQAAAKHLTPVTLELGGKSPCFVDETFNTNWGIKRIVWGKCTNAGQTCVAPDYVLVDKKVKQKFIELFAQTVKEFYGENPQASPDFGRIINEKHFLRLSRFIDKGNVVVGGQTDIANLYIAPTLLDGVSVDDEVMNEEIFGPILPIIEYEKLDDAIKFVNSRNKPLALYIYSDDKMYQERILNETSSGNASINECLMHVGQFELPFGGVGESGIGAYHGKLSFDTFSHLKGILKKSTLSDLKQRFPPYTTSGTNIIRKLIGWFM